MKTGNEILAVVAICRKINVLNRAWTKVAGSLA